MVVRLKTIERSILGELFLTFLIGLVSFNFILMMEKLLKLTRLLSSVGASLLDMLRIIALIQPALFIATTPLSLLIAVLLTYGRLNMDNELTVLRASGMSFWSMTAPVRFFGTACFLIALIFSSYVAPMASVRLKEAVSGIIIQRAPYAVEEGAFNTAFPGLVVYVGGKPSNDALSGIFIYDERDSARPTMLFARTGKISDREGYPVFHLSDGFMHITKGDISTELLFDRYSFSIPLALKEPGRKKSEYTPFELLREAGATDKTARQYKLMLLLEFHRRLTFPLMCLIIPFIAPPLSLVAGKAGRFGGFTIGLAVFGLYYTALVYGERLAVSGTIPHYLGAWLPVALLSVVSFIAFRKAGSK